MRYSYKLLIFIAMISCTIGQRSLTAEQGEESFPYNSYAALLKDNVDDRGMVNYKQLKAGPEQLDVFLDAIAGLDAKTYERWSKKQKIAFWLNTYNALTLKAIIDNYPIKASFFKSAIYPKNSIRQISGVWDEIIFEVMGRGLTLEHIEHKILREKFSEPRIHTALVCAAIGCPPLRNEPYLSEKLEEQLDDQARRFVTDPKKFRIDRENNVVYSSPILKWFAEDFAAKYSPPKNIGRHNRKASATLNFIAAYLEESEKDYILAGDFKIKYLKYDWSLNEQSLNRRDKKSGK